MAIFTSMNGYLDAQMIRSRYKVFNHTHFITSIKGAYWENPQMFKSCAQWAGSYTGREDLTPPIPAPPCSSLSPTHNNTLTDHRKPTGSPQPIPLKKTHSTTPNYTQCICQHSTPPTTPVFTSHAC